MANPFVLTSDVIKSVLESLPMKARKWGLGIIALVIVLYFMKDLPAQIIKPLEDRIYFIETKVHQLEINVANRIYVLDGLERLNCIQDRQNAILAGLNCIKIIQ